MRIVLWLNSRGRAVEAVGPFESTNDAQEFVRNGAAMPVNYHGYSIVHMSHVPRLTDAAEA